MEREAMSIGRVARRSGLPVGTIRFYSDDGLLPPSGRSEAGYRLYTEADLVRLDLIRTLREAGLDLATIRSVLRREMSLGEALQMRLRAIEAHIVSLQRVAAALRAAGSEPDEVDLRRLTAVTRLSNEERRAVIAGFFEKVTEGLPVNDDFTRNMIEGSVPDLTGEPTAQQLDAWVELSELVNDPDFIRSMRTLTEESWTERKAADFDHEAYHQGFWQLMAEVGQLMDRDVEPTHKEATPLVDRFVGLNAGESGDTPEFRAGLLDKLDRHDPRATRYWDLVAQMSGDETRIEMSKRQKAATEWMREALRTRV